ncbi:MAG: phosphoribosylamine--glycine ligase [Alphaproteobacteria bacterium]|jgi:phosphoribosylamine--glycine ligase
MQQQSILILGSGGREHALCYALIKSNQAKIIYCATGNAGIATTDSNVHCANLDIINPQEILDFCQKNQIDFVILGSEAPAAAGVADILLKHSVRVFGCTQQAAMLESSKGFTKDLCQKLNIPTASYIRADNANAALLGLKNFNAPYVIKADGLAAGKGVVIAETEAEAIDAIHKIFAGSFGDAGHQVVIEEFLYGEEASFFVLSDGKNAIPFGTAQDHKRAFDGDKGPNTGGMGSYSPASIVTDAIQQEIMDNIINPVITDMDKQGTPFVGVLYAGLMLTDNGAKLIEFNVRFGDPECQVLMMRLKTDLLTILNAVATQTLDELRPIEWHDIYAVTVVMAANGYPDQKISKGDVISLPQINDTDKAMIFHAGTALNNNKQFIANGGRVLNITATGDNISDATQKAYAIVAQVQWENCFYRTDIAHQEIKRMPKQVPKYQN